MLGVDEAGKGPVLGSMFAAAIRVSDPTVLPEGIDDSKNLSVERRERIAGELRGNDQVSVGIAEIPVARIDDPETDMNSITVEAHAEAIADVLGGARGGNTPVKGIVDAGDTSEERFARRVANQVPAEVKLVAEHKADEKYAVVGAASIVAKVARDAHVETLGREYGKAYGDRFGDLGSGYPADATTRDFLEKFVAEFGRLPDCARRSWATCEKVVADHEQSGLGDF